MALLEPLVPAPLGEGVRWVCARRLLSQVRCALAPCLSTPFSSPRTSLSCTSASLPPCPEFVLHLLLQGVRHAVGERACRCAAPECGGAPRHAAAAATSPLPYRGGRVLGGCSGGSRGRQDPIKQRHSGVGWRRLQRRHQRLGSRHGRGGSHPPATRAGPLPSQRGKP